MLHFRVFPLRSSLQPQQPTRRHGGRALDLGRAGQNDLPGTSGLSEIVGRLANPPLRCGKPQLRRHRPAQPGVRFGPGWPSTLVQTAEQLAGLSDEEAEALLRQELETWSAESDRIV